MIRRKINKRSIGRYIQNIFLGVSILSLGLYIGVSALYFSTFITQSNHENQTLIQHVMQMTQKTLLGDVENNMQLLLSEKKANLDIDFARITDLAQQLKAMIGKLPSGAHMKAIAHTLTQANPNIHSISFIGENQDTFSTDTAHEMNANGFKKSEWYRQAKERGTVYISRPYDSKATQNESLNKSRITISTPCYNDSKDFLGVIAIDCCAEKMCIEKLKSDVIPGSYAMLIERVAAQGGIIGSTLDFKASQTIAEILRKNERPGARAGRITCQIEKQSVIILWEKLNAVNCVFSIVIFPKAIEEPSITTGQNIQKAGWIISKQTDTALKDVIIAFLIMGCIVILAAFIASIYLGNRIGGPIKHLAQKIRKLDQQNWSFISDIQSGDEIQVLSQSFENMTGELRGYLSEITEKTAENEKIENEMNIAKDIQLGILPQMAPPFSHSEHFEIDAIQTPAKAVGGDLYDFFMLSPAQMCLVIGDVSGKGVPASLFMAVTQTLHRGLANNPEIVPSEIVTKLNQSLCTNNSSSMFVTYIFGIFDLVTGRFTYANAGHNPFFLLKHDGTLVDPTEQNGIPLGIFDGMPYTQSELQLHLNDTLFFYTDGVPEAHNIKNEFFDVSRLTAGLEYASQKHLSPRLINHHILKLLDDFVGPADQFDDITLLTMKWKSAPIQGGPTA